jgi:hypothetical protein
MEGVCVSYKKSKHNDLLVVAEELKARSTVMKLIGSHNPWVSPDKMVNLNNAVKMTDAEIYYVASIILELETLKQQRALIDVLHIKCDEETMYKFMSYFPPESLNEMMLSC